MGRKANLFEARRETVEAQLGRLAHARVYLRLVAVRVQAVAAVSEQERALFPAVDDLLAADKLICLVQAEIAARA